MTALLYAASAIVTIVMFSIIMWIFKRNNKRLKVKYAIHGNGTVIDFETKLMWMRSSVGQSDDCIGPTLKFTWCDAVKFADHFEFAGYTGWRLPTIEEQKTLINKSFANPAIDQNVFSNTVAGCYWSSTPYIHNLATVWYIDFNDGTPCIAEIHDHTFYVRLVRDCK